MAGPVRFCPLCQQADDHPRHVIAQAGDNSVARHLDCCRDAGCPDGSCDIVLREAGAKAGTTGDALRKKLTALDADAVRAALDERDEATRNFTADDATQLNGAS